MRRMLTEKDVDKIDSIDSADIETLKATGSPKDVTSGYVLTANGKGKATYKALPDNKISLAIRWYNFEKSYTTDEKGSKFISLPCLQGKADRIINGFLLIPFKAGDTVIPIAEVTTMIWYDNLGQKADQVRIYLSDGVIEKYAIQPNTTFVGTAAYISVKK